MPADRIKGREGTSSSWLAFIQQAHSDYTGNDYFEQRFFIFKRLPQRAGRENTDLDYASSRALFAGISRHS